MSFCKLPGDLDMPVEIKEYVKSHSTNIVLPGDVVPRMPAHTEFAYKRYPTRLWKPWIENKTDLNALIRRHDHFGKVLSLHSAQHSYRYMGLSDYLTGGDQLYSIDVIAALPATF